jgi:23S rRNA (pseudouridine1915-N3)-methyltransferase
LVALSRSGRQLDSRAFAAALDQWRQDPQDLAFLIGGAYGLGDAVQDRCDDAIRLSDLTLPHELARLVLLEQIYRGNTILKGEPYHKGD